jgi:uracil-DNA glycosylase family 4
VAEGTTRRELLARYLRQRAELGQRELYLEGCTGAELLERLRAPAGRRGAPEAGGAEAGVAPVESPAVREATASQATGSAHPFEALRGEVLSCTLCPLAEGRTTVVFGEGDRSADLLVVGEAPGYEEDRQGRPFVGPAGKLLNKMLAAIGFRRDEVFICNVLKCWPPQNRDPVADEVAACSPYLRRQVELVAPKAICAFGRFAAQTLLASDQSLGRLRGMTHEFMGVPVVVTYHPAALLRNQQWKRPAWEDLKVLRRIYDEAGGRTPGGNRG